MVQVKLPKTLATDKELITSSKEKLPKIESKNKEDAFDVTNLGEQNSSQATKTPKHENGKHNSAKCKVYSIQFFFAADPFAPLISKLSEIAINEDADILLSNTNSDLLASSIDSILPIETLQLWNAGTQMNMLSYVPCHCPKNQKVLFFLKLMYAIEPHEILCRVHWAPARFH